MAALRMVLHLRSTSINRRTSIILCRRLPSTFCNSASDNESLPHWARLTLALHSPPPPPALKKTPSLAAPTPAVVIHVPLEVNMRAVRQDHQPVSE